jgi:hypothetical protein
MSDPKDPVYRMLWSEDLEDVDREIARLALLCQVRLLEPGVISRVLHRDASVCGTHNPLAFRMLRDMLMLHLALRDRSANSFGQAQAAALEDSILERLKKSFPDVLAGRLPG